MKIRWRIIRLRRLKSGFSSVCLGRKRAPRRNPGEKEQLADTHWAFQPVLRPELPENLEEHPIDILLEKTRNSELEARTEPEKKPKNVWERISGLFAAKEPQETGLQTAPLADATTILRRLHFGLIGLPPTAEEIRAFTENPDIAGKIDELLARPQYGEHWGRHWLDVARYADTMGYVAGGKDNRYPYAYTYRDWVVHSLNDDMTYGEFVRLQIAADKHRPEGHPDLAALGFLTVGRRANILDVTDDQIDVVSRGILGLTVACARCHDHKFDPIPTRDYYALHGVFRNSVKPAQLPVIGQPDDQKAVAAYEESES